MRLWQSSWPTGRRSSGRCRSGCSCGLRTGTRPHSPTSRPWCGPHIELQSFAHLLPLHVNEWTMALFPPAFHRVATGAKGCRSVAQSVPLRPQLAGTYQQLLALSKQLEQTQAELRLASNVLACSTRLITNLIRFQYNLDPESYEVRPCRKCRLSSRQWPTRPHWCVCCAGSVLVPFGGRERHSGPGLGGDDRRCTDLHAPVRDRMRVIFRTRVSSRNRGGASRSALSKKEMVNNIVQLEEALNLPQDAEKLKKHIAVSRPPPPPPWPSFLSTSSALHGTPQPFAAPALHAPTRVTTSGAAQIMCERLGKSDVGRLALLKQKDQAPPAEPAAGGGGGAPPGAETPA